MELLRVRELEVREPTEEAMRCAAFLFEEARKAHLEQFKRYGNYYRLEVRRSFREEGREMDRPRFDAARFNCHLVSDRIVKRCLGSSLPVVRVEVGEDDRAYGSLGSLGNHAGLLAGLYNGGYLWSDPTHDQRVGSGSNKVASFFEGSLDDIRGYLQMAMPGYWNGVNKKDVGKLFARHVKGVGAVEWPRVKANPRVSVLTGSYSPKSKKEMDEILEELEKKFPPKDPGSMVVDMI